MRKLLSDLNSTDQRLPNFSFVSGVRESVAPNPGNARAIRAESASSALLRRRSISVREFEPWQGSRITLDKRELGSKPLYR